VAALHFVVSRGTRAAARPLDPRPCRKLPHPGNAPASRVQRLSLGQGVGQNSAPDGSLHLKPIPREEARCRKGHAMSTWCRTWPSGGAGHPHGFAAAIPNRLTVTVGYGRGERISPDTTSSCLLISVTYVPPTSDVSLRLDSGASLGDREDQGTVSQVGRYSQRRRRRRKVRVIPTPS